MMGIDLGARGEPRGQLGGHCDNAGKRMMVQTEMRALGVMSGDELCLYYQSRLPGFAYGLDVGCERKRGSRKALGDFPGGSVAKTLRSQCRGLGSIPGWGTRSHMPQLRPCTAK